MRVLVPRLYVGTGFERTIRDIVSAVYEDLQLQEGPHLQASPHAQPAFDGSAFGLWHPHSQAAPGQDLQEHWVELVMICFPFDVVDLLSTK